MNESSILKNLPCCLSKPSQSFQNVSERPHKSCLVGLLASSGVLLEGLELLGEHSWALLGLKNSSEKLERLVQMAEKVLNSPEKFGIGFKFGELVPTF